MIWWRRWLVGMGLTVARWGGWVSPIGRRYHGLEVHPEILESARLMTQQVEERFQGVSGEFKRREALRAMLNRHPDRPVRELALAIEMGLP